MLLYSYMPFDSCWTSQVSLRFPASRSPPQQELVHPSNLIPTGPVHELQDTPAPLLITAYCTSASILDAMLSGIRSGVTDLIGYSVAGAER